MTELNKQGKAKVRRLLDMVVEEVSLVDRPANKRRFLITKRSDDMSTKTKKKSETPEVVPAEAKGQPAEDVSMPGDINAEVAGNESDTEVKDGKDVTEEPTGYEDRTVEALDQMAEAVATLSFSNNKEMLNNLGEKMRELAESLAPVEGSQSDNSCQGDGTSVEKQIGQYAAQADRSESLLKSLNQTLTSLNQKLEPLGELVKSIQELKAIEGSKEDSSEQVKKSSDDNEIKTLSKAMNSLAEVIKDQRQRVARMEKSFGLPNSQPRNEGGSSGSQKDVTGSWPLDLNKPVDRDSVDKSVSFHEM